jgi:hypothetical protein
MPKFHLAAWGGAAIALLRSTTAAAHIDLLEPEARAHGTAARGDTEIDANSNLKSGPCGQVTTGRTARVATYAPGQTITVRVREENAHVSYLRVSLDLDGESFPLRQQAPLGPETQEEASAAEAALGGDGLLAVVRENNDTPGFVHELAVTLPDATCDNCTLQVLQFMYDDPAAPYYFQCADLVIADAATPDAGATPPSRADGSDSRGAATPGAADAMNPGAGGATGAPSTGAVGAADEAAATGVGVSGEAPPAPSATATAANDGASCSLSHGSHGTRSTLPMALLALGLAVASRRLLASGLRTSGFPVRAGTSRYRRSGHGR